MSGVNYQGRFKEVKKEVHHRGFRKSKAIRGNVDVTVKLI